MFENRVPHMLDGDYTPYSALDIFVKDLGIVARECSYRKVPLHIATIAHQLFLSGSAAGWGRQDDSGVVKVYETLTGVSVEGKLPLLKKEVVLQSLPPEWPLDPIDDIQSLNQKNSKTLVVLDDDPTGTQTVHDIEVLTEWTVESLTAQFRKNPKCFFILTNSRSLSSEKASALIEGICRNLCTAAKSIDGIGYTEADAAVKVLGEMDAWIICPFFLQGGRYTIEDIHYVADSDKLVPAGDTEFAKDAAFGYKSSNLREWVEEKTGGRIPANSVTSISIQLLRKGGPEAVFQHLCSLPKINHVSVSYHVDDLEATDKLIWETP
ncbi:putative oxidoreductase YgbJ [Morella rubra]|uniref:Putative oxidoreductase YgbJ n=1 Tax=Morella rubra TaxID=262757 RepID=A0A6A1WCZ8_9ROSI|nr:putative oxidoreductase YgbJ [Morella rubra]